MNPSNTICVSQEGPANALALNKDCTQVVIAGRNVFKVFAIGENEFSEVCNLRVGKNLSLNFSSIDVAWSTIEENTLATAATNGAVVVWNLGRSGRSKQEHVFSDHKRTVNKVSFHLTEPALLISGSQDGMMKCFDLRMKEVARTFISNTESIRDVQFSPHQAHAFAAVSENGSVQVWDVRRHERCLQQFTAHSGPVFACDWHPEVPWLATASRDKTIKVWDIHAKPNLEHTIYTIASVGHVKWRPQKKFQVASCALVLDCAVHVWDVRRPHVPLATFAEHRDVTTAIAWQAGPHAFLSTSRDCSLYRHRFTQAAHPVLWANPHGVGVSARGELAHARPARPLPPLALLAAPAGPARKRPAAGALPAAAQQQLERAFPVGAGSLLCRYTSAPPELPALRVRGASPAELAAYNARACAGAGRRAAALVWEAVRLVAAARASAARGTPAPPPPHDPPRPEPAPRPPPYALVEEEPPDEPEEWADTFHNSGVLGMPTLSIYIPPAKYLRQADAGGWVSAASAHYVDVDGAEWALPEEAFPLRAAPPAHADDAGRGRGAGGAAGGGSASPGGSSSPGSAPPEHAPLSHQNSVSAEEGEGLTVRCGGGGGAAGGAWDAGPALAAALRLHAELGDAQTAACVPLALQEQRGELLASLEEGLAEHWVTGYVELLARLKRWVCAGVAARAAGGAGWAGGAVGVCCARCGRRGRGPCACGAGPPDRCALCRRPVRGLFAWCQGCAHGGHLHHMRRWLAAHQLCPTGCGHRCQLG